MLFESIFKGVKDIVNKAVTDKDLRNKINGELDAKKIEMSQQQAELTAKSIEGARNMQVEIQKTGSKMGKNFIFIFSYVLGLFSILYFFAVSFIPIPQTNIQLVSQIEGFLAGSAFSLVLQFWFGKSFLDKE